MKVKYLFLLIIFMSSPALAAGLSAVIPPHIMRLGNNQTAAVPLSQSDINRIFVRRDRIVGLVAPQSRLAAKKDPSGSLFASVSAGKPFSAFISTERGRHFSLLITPSAMAGATLEIAPKPGPRPAKIRAKKRRPQQVGQKLSKILKGEIPAGYTQVRPSGFSKIPVFDVPRFSPIGGLRQKVIAGFLSDGGAIRAIRLENRSRHTIRLNPDDFFSPGIQALALSGTRIPAGKWATVLEVLADA